MGLGQFRQRLVVAPLFAIRRANPRIDSDEVRVERDGLHWLRDHRVVPPPEVQAPLLHHPQERPADPARPLVHLRKAGIDASDPAEWRLPGEHFVRPMAQRASEDAAPGARFTRLADSLAVTYVQPVTSLLQQVFDPAIDIRAHRMKSLGEGHQRRAR